MDPDDFRPSGPPSVTGAQGAERPRPPGGGRGGQVVVQERDQVRDRRRVTEPSERRREPAPGLRVALGAVAARGRARRRRAPPRGSPRYRARRSPPGTRHRSRGRRRCRAPACAGKRGHDRLSVGALGDLVVERVADGLRGGAGARGAEGVGIEASEDEVLRGMPLPDARQEVHGRVGVDRPVGQRGVDLDPLRRCSSGAEPADLVEPVGPGHELQGLVVVLDDQHVIRPRQLQLRRAAPSRPIPQCRGGSPRARRAVPPEPRRARRPRPRGLDRQHRLVHGVVVAPVVPTWARAARGGVGPGPRAERRRLRRPPELSQRLAGTPALASMTSRSPTGAPSSTSACRPRSRRGGS